MKKNLEHLENNSHSITIQEKEAENLTSLLHPSIKRNAAFTLAEVLITLGIIGVVAALTMPTLISNHQKKTTVTQLKKAVNTISNGMKLVLTDEGVDSLNDTWFYYASYGHFDKYSPNLKKVFNIVNESFISHANNYSVIASSTQFNPSSCNSFITSDGAEICIRVSYATPETHYSNPYLDVVSLKHVYEVYIDINSSKKRPNTLGKDFFVVDFDSNGNIVSSVYAEKSLVGHHNPIDISQKYEDCRTGTNELHAASCFDAIGTYIAVYSRYPEKIGIMSFRTCFGILSLLDAETSSA